MIAESQAIDITYYQTDKESWNDKKGILLFHMTQNLNFAQLFLVHKLGAEPRVVEVICATTKAVTMLPNRISYDIKIRFCSALSSWAYFGEDSQAADIIIKLIKNPYKIKRICL